MNIIARIGKRNIRIGNNMFKMDLPIEKLCSSEMPITIKIKVQMLNKP
jgi:hypothetical protein